MLNDSNSEGDVMTVRLENSASTVKSHWMKALRVISIALVGLYAHGSLAQTTTKITFDTLADGTVITNQYSAQGVNISGATVTNASSLGLPSNSSPNVAYAPDGLMKFTLSIPNVKTVSANITGPANVGIFAYDANGNLVGDAVSSASTSNALLSLTSSGAAITYVEIHDGGASFFVDDVAFTTAPTVPPVPACRAASEAAYSLIAALPASAYLRAKTAALDRLRLLVEVVEFERVRAAGKASQKVLSAALTIIQLDVKLSVKSPQNQPVLQKLDQLNTLIKSNSCQ